MDEMDDQLENETAELPSKLPQNLTTTQLTKYLREKYGVSRTPATLSTLACVGGGPPFRKDGRLRVYPILKADIWVEKQLSPIVSSTAELLATT
jgi:hypothetical protein